MDGQPCWQVLNQQLFTKFCDRWHHMYNHKMTLFTVCLHKVLKKTFWFWYSQLYSAKPILFKYYIIRFSSLNPSGFNQSSNEMRNLFCSLFWIISSSSCLNDQANTCLISLLQEVCIIKSSYPNHWLTLSSGLKKACLNYILLLGWATFFFNSTDKYSISSCLQNFLTDGTTCTITRGLSLLFAVTRCWRKHSDPDIPNCIQPIPFCSNIT